MVTTGGAGGDLLGSGGRGGQSSGGEGGSGTVENLIVNGDFAEGEAHWEFTPVGGAYMHAVISGRLCVTLSSSGYVTLTAN